jgi:hypothetical protein
MGLQDGQNLAPAPNGPRGVIPGRWQVGLADLLASPESITPKGCGGCAVSQGQDKAEGAK